MTSQVSSIDDQPTHPTANPPAEYPLRVILGSGESPVTLVVWIAALIPSSVAYAICRPEATLTLVVAGEKYYVGHHSLYAPREPRSSETLTYQPSFKAASAMRFWTWTKRLSGRSPSWSAFDGLQLQKTPS